MSGANKIALWSGMTQSHAFHVEVFEDEEQGLFIVHINAHKPPLATALRLPGQRPERMGLEDEVKLQSDDLDVLQALTRKHIQERYGTILQFRDLPA